MDNEEIRYDEYSLLPEHDIPPEYTPEYPDVSFFQESSVTAREENIFQGETPTGEEDLRSLRKKARQKRARFSWLRNLLGSALRGGAAVLGVCALVVTVVSGADLSEDSPWFPVKAMVADLKRKPLDTPEDYGPEELLLLWNGDPEGPHQYDFEHAHVRREASCLEDGIIEYYCRECGIALPETVPGGHAPLPAVRENERAAGCTEDGGYDDVVYCSTCHEVIERKHTVYAATGHHSADPVIENVVGALCTAGGSYDSVIYCSDCHSELSRETILTEAMGHTAAEAVKENETAPSCAQTGSYDSVVYCSVCHEELSRETVTVDALGHHEGFAVKENEKEPSCTETGSYESVVYCMVCGGELSRETVTLPMTAHIETQDIEENRMDPTCTETGTAEIAVYCDICGKELSREEVVLEALGHTPEEEAVIENETEATCAEEGGYDEVFYCSVCGEEVTREHTVLEALGHSEGEPKEENRVAATCTAEGGYDTVVYCSVCSEELSRTHTTLDKIPHTAASAVRENTKNATCTAAGSYDEVVYCSVCHSEMSRTKKTIAATGHSYSDTVTAPTCTARGYTTHTCSRCGDSYTDSYKDALGHSWGTPTYTWSSNNSQVTATRTCQNDSSHKETETVSTSSQVTSEATCSATGNRRYTSGSFSNSAFTVQTKNVTIDKIAHTEGDRKRENYIANTCTTAGSVDYVTYCSVCGEVMYRQSYEIPAHGHSFTMEYNDESTLKCIYCDTLAITISFSTYPSGNGTFYYTLNSDFLSQLQNNGCEATMHVETADDSRTWVNDEEAVVWDGSASGSLLGLTWGSYRESFPSGSKLDVRLLFSYWDDSHEYCAFSETIKITIP